MLLSKQHNTNNHKSIIHRKFYFIIYIYIGYIGQGFTDAATYFQDIHKFPLFSTSGSVTQFD